MPGGMGGNDWQPGCYNPELGITYHKLHNSFQEAWWRFEGAGQEVLGRHRTRPRRSPYNGHIHQGVRSRARPPG